MTNKEQAYEIIKILVDKFEQGIASYKNNDYNETETRNEFIDPFWKALGWDLENKAKLSPVYKEVVVEKTQKVGSDYYRPDYNFRNSSNGKILFYFEAKKPFVNLKNDLAPALQARRYGYQNNSVNISILANFEEFAIYNCRKKTRANDTAKTARLEFLTYKDYLSRFDFIWEVFAKENAQNGSIEAYTDKFKEIRESKDSIDADFLNSLETWRKFLATDIAQKNPNLEEFQLNFTVQQTIDRIVFLKIAEDREIEPEKKLFNAAKKGNIYDNIFDLFITADQRYNSGLFNFKKDVVSRNIKIDNKILRAIIKELYEGSEEEGHNGIGYRFDIIPVEILGYAYEQFLGNVIRIDANGSAIIEPKPEVRKAGGVFYTPVEVVNYIVENTIGEKIKEISPQIAPPNPPQKGGLNNGLDIIAEIAKIKIIDPACGSGSFLLGAYDFLLKWHLDFYTKNPKAPLPPKSPTQPSPQGGLKTPSPLGRVGVGLALTPIGTLTSAVKKQILLNNIFGVDIDEQAVEVTKLSLLIKCLEGETEATVAEQLLFNNSPFGGKGGLLPTLDNNILCGNSLINHDFYEGGLFPTAKEMRKINTFDWKQGFAEVFKAGGFDCVIGNPPYVRIHLLEKKQLNYLQTNYKSAKGQTDLYSIFIEKAISNLKENGYLSFINPRFLQFNLDSEEVRKILLEQNIIALVEVGKAFEQASTECMIFVMQKNTLQNAIQVFEYYPKQTLNFVKNVEKSFFQLLPNVIFNTVITPNEFKIIQKLQNQGRNLKEIVNIKRGMEIGKVEIRKNKKGIKTLLGEDVNAYVITYQKTFCLAKHKEISRLQSVSEIEKVLIRRVANHLIATYDTENYYFIKNLYSLSSTKINLKYLTGLLNSKLLNFFLKKYFTTKKEDIFPEIQVYQLEQLPIKILNTSNKLEQQQQDKLILLVEKMLDLQQKTALAKIPQEKTMYERLLQNTDNQINGLVYELYELTSEEIEVIENQK